MMHADVLQANPAGDADTLLMPYDSQLVEVISSAASRMLAQLDDAMPFMAPRVRGWIQTLYDSLPVADAFQLPASFPMVFLPWALEETIRGTLDTTFQSDLVFSTMNGYHYIRFIDNVMDDDAPAPKELLPIVAFFYFQAHAAYQRHFPHDHPFWQTFKTCWLRCADVTARDASLEECDRSLFVEVASQKTSAGKIPLAAVCWKYDRFELFEPWSRFHDTLGCWYQMTNDLRDWHTDLGRVSATYFLSEGARQKNKRESIAEWIAREGYAWAVDTLDNWMAEMKTQAAQLGSPTLLDYLDVRDRVQSERHSQFLEVLPHVDKLIIRLRTTLGE